MRHCEDPERAKRVEGDEAISDQYGIASPRPRFLLSQESSEDHVRNDIEFL